MGLFLGLVAGYQIDNVRSGQMKSECGKMIGDIGWNFALTVAIVAIPDGGQPGL